MTDDQMQSVRDDIAYMRGLAHEGRTTPLLGGSILIAAGLIFGTASVGHWAIISGVVGLSVSALTPMWLVATLGFFVALTVGWGSESASSSWPSPWRSSPRRCRA